MQKQLNPVVVVIIIVAFLVVAGVVWKLAGAGKKAAEPTPQPGQYNPQPTPGTGTQPYGGGSGGSSGGPAGG